VFSKYSYNYLALFQCLQYEFDIRHDWINVGGTVQLAGELPIWIR